MSDYSAFKNECFFCPFHFYDISEIWSLDLENTFITETFISNQGDEGLYQLTKVYLKTLLIALWTIQCFRTLAPVASMTHF